MNVVPLKDFLADLTAENIHALSNVDLLVALLGLGTDRVIEGSVTETLALVKAECLKRMVR
jgi:hypothetical protein